VKAIISDIHSNLEALRAVLDDIKQRGVSDVVCLGDVVGYGPNPKECIDIIKKTARVTILGNHDEAALFESEARYFNYRARGAIEWTRNQLEDERDVQENSQRWNFLGELRRRHSENGILYVHASPRNPVKEYVFPEDVVYNPEKMEDIFSYVEHIAFIGHTHLPGVFRDDRKYWSPEDLGGQYQISPNKKAIINIGSVGQPRDGNPEASYGILDNDVLIFSRVPYEYRQTMKKIFQIEGLDKDLAERLAEGR
jgi:predicted phosphodiesterase